jgi:hypothetical protein
MLFVFMLVLETLSTECPSLCILFSPVISNTHGRAKEGSAGTVSGMYTGVSCYRDGYPK